MCLRFAFLLITRAAAWLRLSQREETWKTAEILILRHQLTILQQRCPHRPNLNWADRVALLSIWLLARWLISALECSRGDVRAVWCVPGGG
jgi:hypothetical protein